MPPLSQTTYLCPICFQRFFEVWELGKHYGSSHGDLEDLPRYIEGNDEEGEEDGEEVELEMDPIMALDVRFPVR